jgi:hypothetical protein
MLSDDMCCGGKGAEEVGPLGCEVWIGRQANLACAQILAQVPLLACAIFCHMKALTYDLCALCRWGRIKLCPGCPRHAFESTALLA